jgi:hypothetical protein
MEGHPRPRAFLCTPYDTMKRFSFYNLRATILGNGLSLTLVTTFAAYPPVRSILATIRKQNPLSLALLLADYSH